MRLSFLSSFLSSALPFYTSLSFLFFLFGALVNSGLMGLLFASDALSALIQRDGGKAA